MSHVGLIFQLRSHRNLHIELLLLLSVTCEPAQLEKEVHARGDRWFCSQVAISLATTWALRWSLQVSSAVAWWTRGPVGGLVPPAEFSPSGRSSGHVLLDLFQV